jgi:hypothetical protein
MVPLWMCTQRMVPCGAVARVAPVPSTPTIEGSITGDASAVTIAPFTPARGASLSGSRPMEADAVTIFSAASSPSNDVTHADSPASARQHYAPGEGIVNTSADVSYDTTFVSSKGVSTFTAADREAVVPDVPATSAAVSTARDVRSPTVSHVADLTDETTGAAASLHGAASPRMRQPAPSHTSVSNTSHTSSSAAAPSPVEKVFAPGEGILSTSADVSYDTTFTSEQGPAPPVTGDRGSTARAWYLDCANYNVSADVSWQDSSFLSMEGVATPASTGRGPFSPVAPTTSGVGRTLADADVLGSPSQAPRVGSALPTAQPSVPTSPHGEIEDTGIGDVSARVHGAASPHNLASTPSTDLVAVAAVTSQMTSRGPLSYFSAPPPTLEQLQEMRKALFQSGALKPPRAREGAPKENLLGQHEPFSTALATGSTRDPATSTPGGVPSDATSPGAVETGRTRSSEDEARRFPFPAPDGVQSPIALPSPPALASALSHSEDEELGSGNEAEKADETASMHSSASTHTPPSTPARTPGTSRVPSSTDSYVDEEHNMPQGYPQEETEADKVQFVQFRMSALYARSALAEVFHGRAKRVVGAISAAVEKQQAAAQPHETLVAIMLQNEAIYLEKEKVRLRRSFLSGVQVGKQILVVPVISAVADDACVPVYRRRRSDLQLLGSWPPRVHLLHSPRVSPPLAPQLQLQCTMRLQLSPIGYRPCVSRPLRSPVVPLSPCVRRKLHRYSLLTTFSSEFFS